MAEEEVQEEKKSGGNGLIVVLIIMMFLMMIGMGALAFLLLSKDDSKKSDDKEEVHADASHGEEEYEEEGGEKGDDGIVRNYSPKFKQYAPPEPGAPPMYFAMEPFVVNFKGEGQAKFLAVTLKFMSHYPQLVGDAGDMSHLKPILRNDITSLLRKQTYTEMNADDGSEVLRARILEKTREIVKKHGIYPDLIEDVYFERFVMQ